jgi:UDP-glucose 4-epimerase
VNLGGATEVTVNSLAQRVVTVLGSNSPIVHVPYEQAYGPGYEDMRRRVPDNSLAHRLIGYDPRTSIEDMIRAVAGRRLMAATVLHANGNGSSSARTAVETGPR